MDIKNLKGNLKVEPNFEAQDDIIKDEIQQETVAFIDKVPAHWTLIPTENGVKAVNVSSRETFEGSILEFNKRLRG